MMQFELLVVAIDSQNGNSALCVILTTGPPFYMGQRLKNTSMSPSNIFLTKGVSQRKITHFLNTTLKNKTTSYN